MERVKTPAKEKPAPANPPVFIISFLRRYSRLLIVFLVLALLGKSDHVTYFTGPIFYLILLSVGAIVSALFLRHLFFRQSLDAYAQDRPNGEPSDFVGHWQNLCPETKVKLTLYVLIAFFLGCSWIAASIAR